MKKHLCTLFLCILTGAAQSQQPYAIPDTAVYTLAAKDLRRDYDIYVSLPVSYNASTRRYPVVFVADAPYAFPLLRSISRRVGDTGKSLEEIIIVGLGYAKGDTANYGRRRDYTPTADADPSWTSDMPGRPLALGQAEGFRRFIASEVFPFIEKNYRADMTRKVFIGHSYGSLLGLQALFTEPTMFDTYILGSPSLWYGKRVMFEREKAYAGSHKDLKARIYLGVGGLETQGDDNMVADMKEFKRLLVSRHYPGLHIESRIFADEDHFTVAPQIATRGLKWTLPQK